MVYFKFVPFFLLLLVTFTSPGKGNKSPVDYVDPNIGTAHCRWFFYTPAAVPFGMAKLAPSTDAHLGNPGGWQAVGYDFRHTSIEGFAHFHEFQVGGVVVAPTVGELQTVPGRLEAPEEGYRSSFKKSGEVAKPGYYAVYLDDYKVLAELTATKRVGFHRYTFPETDQAHIIFDIGNKQGESGEVKDARVSYSEDGMIEGYVITSPVYVNIYQKGADVRMYFAGKMNKNPVSFGTFIRDRVNPGNKEEHGLGAGMYFTFQTGEKEAIEMKVGLSYTSVANARLNLETEARNLNFDKARKLATKTWKEYLGRIAVEGSIETDKTKFYTGLFHALLGRGLASDVNGAYPKNNGETGQIPLDEKGRPVHHHYNTDAIWGAFWNLTQLWALAYPEYFSEWIQSQLLVFRDAGWLGDGIACSKYVSGVGTNFTGLAIAAAYNCGIRDFDVETAYEAALKNETGWKGRTEGAGKMDTRQFIERGYTPYEDHLQWKTTEEGSGFGASHTLEYSFGSFAVGQFARHLGKMDDFQRLSALSKGWKRLFDEETKLIRPRNSKGEFIPDFDPLAPWRGFQEGNAVQYTFYVPHDVEELIGMLGKETFNNRLDSIFTESQKHIFGGGKEVDAFAGLKTLYNHGNQPNLHTSWMFNFSGKPWLSQKWVRAICNEFYGTEGIHGYGYGQDEDQGQLGAWYVMSSLGLFDVKGLTEINPQFQIGAPLFDKVTIRLNRKYYKGKNLYHTDKRQWSCQSVYPIHKAQRGKAAICHGSLCRNCKRGIFGHSTGEEPQYFFAMIAGNHLACLAAIGTPLFLNPSPSTAQDRKQPNIVCIFTDDHAFQAISAYGHPISRLAPTPNIDRLAAGGMLFTHAFVENSISTPSRATLLTGLYSHQHGQTLLGSRMNPDKKWFVELLQEAGYVTSVFGKWHLNVDPKGFDYYDILFDQGDYYNPGFRTPYTNGAYIPENGYATTLITDHAIRWLAEHAPKDAPFCMLVNHKAPHRNWMPDLPNLNLFNDITFPEPSTLFDDYNTRGSQMLTQELTIREHMGYAFDFKVGELKDEPTLPYIRDSWPMAMNTLTPEQREIWDKAYAEQNKDFLANRPQGDELVRWKYQRYIRDYCRTIRSVDEQVGRLIAYLEETGQLENTLIMYTSDQGFLLGEHGLYDKRFMYEESMRTPLIIFSPRHIKAGSVCHELVQNIDFAPTFLDIAGVPVPGEMAGESMVPLFKNGKSPKWRKELYYHFYDYPAVGMVRKHYGIRTDRYKLIHWYGKPYGDDPAIDFWELYDLKKDPSEVNNLYGNKKYRRIQQKLRENLIALRRNIGSAEGN